MTHPKASGSKISLDVFAGLLSSIALLLAIYAVAQQTERRPVSAKQAETAWSRTKREKRLRVGIGVVPPYTMVDASTQDPDKRYSGYCIDMVKEIAQRFSPPWEIEWHQVNWSSLRAEMYSGKFDFVANIIYQTVPQAAEFDLTIPYSYVSVGLGLVKKGNNRFQRVEQLNDPTVTISLASGWTATEYARAHMPRAKLLIKDVGDSTNVQLEDILAGRADIVLQDAPTVYNIARNHPNAVDVLWSTNPPMRVPAGFLLRKGETEYKDFLDVAIRALQADGTLLRLDEKWKTVGEYPKESFRLGSGIPH